MRKDVATTVGALVFAGATTVLSWGRSTHPLLLEVPFRGFGFVVIGIGWLAWRSEHWARFGPLVVLVGGTYYLQDLRAFTPTFAIGFCLAYLWTAVVAHVVLSWPDRPPVPLVVACYVSAVGSQVLRFVVDRPRPPVTISSPYDHTWVAKFGSVLVTVLTLVVVLVVVRRWLNAGSLRRDLSAPVWAAVVVAGVVATFASVLEVRLETEHALLVASLSVSLLLVPAVVFGAAARVLRARLTSLVLDRDLDLQSDPDLLRRELAECSVIRRCGSLTRSRTGPMWTCTAVRSNRTGRSRSCADRAAAYAVPALWFAIKSGSEARSSTWRSRAWTGTGRKGMDHAVETGSERVRDRLRRPSGRRTQVVSFNSSSTRPPDTQDVRRVVIVHTVWAK